MNRIRVLAFAAALGLLATMGCGDDDPVVSDEPIDVTTYFNLNVDGQPLILANLGYANAAGTAYSIKTLRFVITDVVLHNGAGGSFKLADLHYYDLSDPSTQSFKVNGLPHEEWNSITFTFGLDETDNVRDKYLSRTKFHLDMAWPSDLGTNLGYHYMQLEGDYETGPGTTAAYATHMGPRQLDGTNDNFPGVVDATPHHFHFGVDLPFTPEHIHNGGHGELTINFNLNDWYKDSDVGDGQDTQYNFPDYSIVMGNLDAQGKLHTNGRFCFSADFAAYGGHH